MTAVVFILLIIAGLCVFVIAHSSFMLYRNQRIYTVRKTILDMPDCYRMYLMLPEYRAMLEHPKYWLLWSLDDWLAWIDRQPQRSAS